MLEEFLEVACHPNRAVELLNAFKLLDEAGLSGHVRQIREILLGERGIEVPTILSNVESALADGLASGLALFGVDIEYDPNEISLVADLLQFLVTWDTPEGFTPSQLGDRDTVYDLGVTEVDILLELFQMAGHNSDGRLIDWVLSVSPSLIERINAGLKPGTLPSDEPSALPLAALSDFKLFAVRYPDARIVAHVKLGGGLGLSLNTLILQHDDMLQECTQQELAIELLGMGLISSLPREDFLNQLLKTIEPAIGATLSGQRVVTYLRAAHDKVFGQ